MCPPSCYLSTTLGEDRIWSQFCTGFGKSIICLTLSSLLPNYPGRILWQIFHWFITRKFNYFSDKKITCENIFSFISCKSFSSLHDASFLVVRLCFISWPGFYQLQQQWLTMPSTLCQVRDKMLEWKQGRFVLHACFFFLSKYG